VEEFGCGSKEEGFKFCAWEGGKIIGTFTLANFIVLFHCQNILVVFNSLNLIDKVVTVSSE
jgi:hypothetical protein